MMVAEELNVNLHSTMAVDEKDLGEKDLAKKTWQKKTC
jgi:hypothetical protein